ncbi:MAG TPA: DNA-processing protein DprA [Candidatus Rubrimentiphilum sp.]|nr:DNA-processing protein DprA [Candidatus Rubrimentiphilum sp.]
MREMSHEQLVLLAGAYLHMPARRLRSLARGEDPSLKEWLEGDSARRLAHARRQAREASAKLARLGASLVTIADPRYPKALRDLDDPPAFLCVRGALPADGIAIVGTRTPLPAAQEFAREFARRLELPIVSGLAAGIDSAAHRGALDAGVPTVAYVGTGLGVTYPPENRSLEEEIVAHGGAIVSERLPDEPVSKPALVHRDRLQAAHARAVVLVASESNGGAMLTMRFAKQLGRPRFAVAAYGDPSYSGNAQAHADGARVLPFDVDRALHALQEFLSASPVGVPS